MVETVETIAAAIRHPVPVAVRGTRGRPLIGRAEETARVEIRGVPAGGLSPRRIDYILDEDAAFAFSDRLWTPLAGADGAPLPLDRALSLLADGHPFPGTPLAVRGRPPVAAPSSVPGLPEASERATAAVRAFAGEDLVHDGRHLYRAAWPRLLHAETMPTWRRIEDGPFPGAPGLLPERLGPEGTVPLDLPMRISHVYRDNVAILSRKAADSLAGVVHGPAGPADLVAFANDAPAMLLAALTAMGARAAGLREVEARLAGLALAGCVLGIRGDDLAPAIAAIEGAGRAMAAAGCRLRTLPAMLSFVERIARPALEALAPATPAEDAAGLSALAP